MKKLVSIKKSKSGRSHGKVVVRHQGGYHKRYIRYVDFKRRDNEEGKVISLEYDPGRSADIALIQYADGGRSYIIAPHGLKTGQKIESGKKVSVKNGNAILLSAIPVGTVIHNVEITPGRGGQIARGAGVGAIVAAKEGDFAHLKLPSGEIRKIRLTCMATVGTASNIDHKNEVIGKAGRARNMGIRPTVRGVAQNPRSHAHGGGEGRSGIGLKIPKTYAGRPAYGKTRRKKKYSNKYIIQTRN